MADGHMTRLFSPREAYADGQVIDCGDYALRLKVNRRARRISLRIDNKTGEAVASAPSPRHLKDAVAFARARHDWIVGMRRREPERLPRQTLETLGVPHDHVRARAARDVQPEVALGRDLKGERVVVPCRSSDQDLRSVRRRETPGDVVFRDLHSIIGAR